MSDKFSMKNGSLKTSAEVSDFIDTMLDAAQHVGPGQMVSFAMAPAESVGGEKRICVQGAGNDPAFEEWVRNYVCEQAHEEDDPNLCVQCGESPCVWDQAEDVIDRTAFQYWSK